MRVVLFAEPLEKQHAGIHVYTREMIRALLQYDQKNEYILLRSKKDHFFPEAQQVVVPNVFKAMRNDPLRLMLNVPQVLKATSARLGRGASSIRTHSRPCEVEENQHLPRSHAGLISSSGTPERPRCCSACIPEEHLRSDRHHRGQFEQH